MEKQQILHLYRRAGFGILPKVSENLSVKGRRTVVNELFKSSANVIPFKIQTPEIDAYLANAPAEKNPKRFRELIKASRKMHVEFNKVWVERMVEAPDALRERMTLFWASHFVVQSRNVVFLQQFNNVLREHALGNFRDFVLAVAKAPAMLDYFNNQQNRKDSPNENFARELMELFTLGEGRYTEQDIKEAARAFTGWGHNAFGEFRFRKKLHDFEEKIFFGKTGNFDGQDIIDSILEREECALFVCEKIYAHFVNENIEMDRVFEMASVFRKNYDISEVMRFVFLSDWFYRPEHIGSKIKSPIDVLVGLKRTVPFTFENPKQLIYVERLLGQVLLEPPNVAGWAEGRNWIDMNTMMVRMKLPSVLLMNGTISFDVKGEFEETFKEHNKQNNLSRKLPTVIDWNVFDRNYGHLSYEALASHLLGGRIKESTRTFLEKLEKVDAKEACVQLMSLPEYQLC